MPSIALPFVAIVISEPLTLSYAIISLPTLRYPKLVPSTGRPSNVVKSALDATSNVDCISESEAPRVVDLTSGCTFDTFILFVLEYIP